jgi:Protein of unknown function (DUF1501)
VSTPSARPSTLHFAPSRREMMQIGFSSVLGLSLPNLLQASSARQADACIVIFLNGGPSHLDMWDMKPDAPAEVRGEFKPIATSQPGVQVSEHLPRLARQMHRCTLIRSAHHSVNNAHAAAVYCALTGHDRGEKGGGARPTDHPSIGSVLGLRRPPPTATVPYVLLPYITKEGAGGPPQPGFFGGWLGHQRDPLFVLRDPNAPNFKVPELVLPDDIPASRMQARKDLLHTLSACTSRETLAPDLDGFQQKAFDLLTGPTMQRAFQINKEPPRVRDGYGRNIYGQSVLLARRLVEAGTRLVCVSWAPDANATWDTHGGNFKKLKSTLLPALDAAVSSLLEDLVERGMLERTLVVVMGEFGRTPKINKNQDGRDHWNFCYSLLLAGAGLRAGYVHGSSDSVGGRPSSQPVTPADIVATIYHCLGIPSDLELYNSQKRPSQLVPWGKMIPDLLA